MKHPAVAAVALGAAVILIGGAVVAVIAYHSGTTSRSDTQATPAVITAAQTSDYRGIVEAWPYPLAPGDALPVAPPELAGISPSTDTDRTYVSFFYQCSWMHALIDGPPSRHDDALLSLRAWNDLPASVSTALNADGGWKTHVLDPAIAGDLTPITDAYASCTPYATTRVGPAHGLTIDKPLPSVSTAPPTSDLPAAVGDCPIEDAVDSGPTTGARGRATLNAAGVPVAYTVAADDAYYRVAERFGIADACLFPLNCVRRSRSDVTALYIGDTINLDWHTVTSVGDTDGKVYDNSAFCFHADPPYPPQR